MEVSLSPLTTNAGTYTVMIVRRPHRQHAAEQGSRDQMLLDDQERTARRRLSTSVMYTIHAIALRIANLVAEVDRPAADELHRVRNDLDNTVAAIRGTEFSIGTD